MSREYNTIRALRRGEVVDLDGLRLVQDGDGDVGPGDLYVAERNTGPKLLTCERVHEEGGWVVARENAYSFDTHECVKVKEAS